MLSAFEREDLKLLFILTLQAPTILRQPLIDSRRSIRHLWQSYGMQKAFCMHSASVTIDMAPLQGLELRALPPDLGI